MAQPTCPDMTVDNLSMGWSGSRSGCSSLDPSKYCGTGDLITFDVAPSGYDFGCGAHKFTWDFGDSTSFSQVKSPAHTYPAVTGLERYTVRLTISNGRGILMLVETLSVFSAPTTTTNPRIAVFFADVSRTMRGQSVTLFWRAENTYLIQIDPIGYEGGGTGRHTFIPEKTATYTLTAYSTSATAGKSLNIEVIDTPCTAPPPPVSIDWLGQTTGCTRANAKTCGIREPIVFAVQPFGNTVPSCFHQFQWTFGDGTTSTRQNPTSQFLGPGDFPVQLIVTNAAGVTMDSSPLQIGSPPLSAIAYFIATPSTVSRGQAVTLRWSARNTSELLISPLNLRTNELNGTYVVTPTENTTYTMTASGASPAAQGGATAAVVVNPPSRRRSVKH